MVTIHRPPAHVQRGTSMMEVLVTIAILVFGLLGIVGMQARLQVAEMESYQRAQALILLNDMANRIAANRRNADSYLTTSGPLGAGMTCPATTTTRQQVDAGEWCNALQGAGETTGGSKIGAMVGGRGCVTSLGAGAYLVVVAWQGLTPIPVPANSPTCGQGSYQGGAGSSCVDDRCRRIVTTVVRIATLI